MTFSGFYKKTREERINILQEKGYLSKEKKELLLENKSLDVNIAGKMAENHIATFSLPFCVSTPIKINNKEYIIPMVTEEPSVVAALSNAGKIISKSGGFSTLVDSRLMIGQVILYDIKDINWAILDIIKNKEKILKLANESHPSIVKRGGGAIDIDTETFQNYENEFLVVYLTVDVKEAMGANIINTMLEGIKPYLQQLTESKSLMAILSNYATKSIVTSRCEIDIKYLHEDIEQAKEIAKKIELASKIAKLDPYRATTHNKGIFNGIDAVTIASGNDFRAIESAGHAYATKDGKYRGLSTWTYNEDKNSLRGILSLPMPVASVGGSIGLNESVKIAREILNNPNAKELAQIIVTVGLAQNFSAIRALVTVGIQKGHMKLHAKSLLLLAGAKEEDVEILAEKFANIKQKNLATAKELIQSLKK